MALSRNEKAQWIKNGKQKQWFRHVDQVQFSIQPETEPGLFRQRSSFAHLGLREQNEPSVCSVELRAAVS